MIKSAKYILAAFFTAGLLITANAQITPRPASWTSAGDNGFNAFLTPLTAGQIADFTAAGVNIASDGTVSLPSGFNLGNPGISLNPLGGKVDVFFIGESAGWKNDFGYVINPATANLTNPSTYNPLVVNIESVTSGTPAVGTLVNNTKATVSYSAGQTLDFFLNGVGDPWSAGGTWFAFGTPNQFNGSDNTIHTKYKYVNIQGLSTLILSFEDSRASSVDADYSDFIIALQGVGTPVPEPTTYGLIGASALLVLVFFRRFKR